MMWISLTRIASIGSKERVSSVSALVCGGADLGCEEMSAFDMEYFMLQRVFARLWSCIVAMRQLPLQV